jgi:hypothetical protein
MNARWAEAGPSVVAKVSQSLGLSREFLQQTQPDCLADVYMCQRSLSQNRRVSFCETIFGNIPVFR